MLLLSGFYMRDAVALVCMPSAPPLPHFTSTNFREHSISNEKVGPAQRQYMPSGCPSRLSVPLSLKDAMYTKARLMVPCMMMVLDIEKVRLRSGVPSLVDVL